MRITLFNLSAKLSSDGPRLISSLLKSAGNKVQSVYFARSEPLLYDNEELRLLDPILIKSDIVMIGVYSTYAARAAQLTDYIHKKHYGLKVIWGGPHCISAPELSVDYADGVCFSEADEAIIEFVKRVEKGEDYYSTPNMAFKIDCKIIKNKIFPPFQRLDDLPYCDYDFSSQYILDKHLMQMNKTIYQERISCYPYNIPNLFVLAARGCPNNCSYCNNYRYTELFKRVNPIRIQSNERVIDEIENTLKIVDFVKMIGFGDDDFFVRSEKMLEEFAGIYKKKIGLPLMIGLSANSFNKRKMEILLDIGLKIIQMGVQSGSEIILKNIYNRNIKAEKTMHVVNQIAPYNKSHRLDLLLDFIIDNPYETKNDIIETFNYILKLPKIVKLNVFFLAFFPGTLIYDRAIKDGIIDKFKYDSFRFYRRGKIKYQYNYETMLLILLCYIREKKYYILLKHLIKIFGSYYFRIVANIMPGRFYAFCGNIIIKKWHIKKNMHIKKIEA